LAYWPEDVPYWAVCVYLLANWRVLYQISRKSKGKINNEKAQSSKGTQAQRKSGNQGIRISGSRLSGEQDIRKR
jgi:hypothetical protein